MQEFIDFCVELFPCISPYTAERVKEAIGNYQSLSSERPFTTTENMDEILQGDIFSEMPFLFYDENGQLHQIYLRAQLLSNSCDIVRDDKLIFVGVLPDDFKKEDKQALEGIRKNIKYGHFCIPTLTGQEYITDFSLVMSYPRQVFERFIQQNKVRKIASLTQFGYYFLLTKLTIFLLRPESNEVIRT